MAKIKHNNFLETVNEVFTDATQEGVLHLYADENTSPGRTIIIKGRKLYHFGTTGYLGLEQDSRLKKAAISAIKRYGTQFPLSKSYISHPLYKGLEEKVSKMYQTPTIITKNSTLGHLGAIPSAINDRDAIILDHQVHWSVQSAAKVLKTRSVPIEMIRHNQLNMLEDKIKSLSPKRRKIWYMADGIYSMYGDYAPVKQLMELANKYPQLHLYFDDVHGMSWIGKNGTGYVLSEIGEVTDQMLLFGTLSKTFGASGAVLACSDKKMYKKIKTFGGPLTFSAQLEPASVAAATASAKIHLSSEIYQLQRELRERIEYFNQLLNQTNLPLIDQNNSPVFYIGTGMPMTGYNFVNRLMKEGFFVNLGIFPAVPVKNTGVRITISRHNGFEEIKALVEAMVYHFPKSLEDSNTSLNRVNHAFKIEQKKEKPVTNTELNVQLESFIKRMDKSLWNSLLGKKGVYDWEGLKFLEDAFSGNDLKEHNWNFRYLIIRDKDSNPILATFFTNALWKDDMLSKPSVSEQIEKERLNDPYYLTSKVVSMGSLFTEGEHIYLDKDHHLSRKALNVMVQTLENLEQTLEAKMIVLRDFDTEDSLNQFFHGQGFIKVQMPDTCQVLLKDNQTIEEYIGLLSARNRRHCRKEILALEPVFEIGVLKNPDHQFLDQIKELYNNVHKNNLGLNTFSFPDKLFAKMCHHKNWEFITIGLKSKPEKIIGAMLCYNNLNETYTPAFVGLDYDYVKPYNTYRQLLYQTIKRAIDLNYKRIDFGMTAAFEKRKLGACITEKYAYIQASDNYSLELMGIMENQR